MFDDKFAVIAVHLLPLTRYVSNGQYALVQPIASNHAERCNYTTLTTNGFIVKSTHLHHIPHSPEWEIP